MQASIANNIYVKNNNYFILIFSIIYINNISYCYIYFNKNNQFRFWSEYFYTFLYKYFKHKNNIIFFNKLYKHKYKHGFNLLSMKYDKIFIKKYKKIINKYFYNENFKKRNLFDIELDENKDENDYKEKGKK